MKCVLQRSTLVHSLSAADVYCLKTDVYFFVDAKGLVSDVFPSAQLAAEEYYIEMAIHNLGLSRSRATRSQMIKLGKHLDEKSLDQCFTEAA
jgi:hypothetical protein